MIEAKKPLKAKLAGELAAAADESERKEIKAEFEARERALEHDIDHTPRELSMVRCAPELNPCRDRVSHPCLSRSGPGRQVQLPLKIERLPGCVGTSNRKLS
jgi:hypothetical protein